MDLISVVGLVDASVSLASKCGSAIKDLNDVTSRFKNAELTVRSITQSLEILQFSWDRISTWSQTYIPYDDRDEDGFVRRMAHFLETGNIVMNALEEELLPYRGKELTFGQRLRLVWNEKILQLHQSRVRDQAASVSIFLQAIQL